MLHSIHKKEGIHGSGTESTLSGFVQRNLVQFRLMSDLHLEFYPSAFALYEQIQFTDRDADSYLILAGDIGYPVKYKKKLHPNPEFVDFLTRMRPHFRGVLLVSGNHEYYRCTDNGITMDEIDQVIRDICDVTDVIYLQKNTVHIEHVVIHGCTMFSNVTTEDSGKMHDIKYIAPRDKLLATYNNHVQWLNQMLVGTNNNNNSNSNNNKDNNNKSNSNKSNSNKGNSKVLIITHHLPFVPPLSTDHQSTYIARISGYCNDFLSNLFSSAVEPEKNCIIPDVWCCGHIHVPIDYVYYDEELVTNRKVRVMSAPMGYVRSCMYLVPTYFTL